MTGRGCTVGVVLAAALALPAEASADYDQAGGSS
jgi:ribonuclease HII